MKKSLLALTAVPLLLANSMAFAIESSPSEVTIKIDPIQPSCELKMKSQEAYLGKKVEYSAKSYNGSVPFIRVETWDHSPTSINMNNAVLERIAFGANRPVVADPDPTTQFRDDFFKLSQRENVTIAPGTEETKLGIVLTCHEDPVTAEEARKVYENAGGDDHLYGSNLGLGFDYNRDRYVGWHPALSSTDWVGNAEGIYKKKYGNDD